MPDVQLPSGGTAQLRSSLTVGGRKGFKRARLAVLETPMGQEMADLLGEQGDVDPADEQAVKAAAKASEDAYKKLMLRYPTAAATLGDAENEALVLGYVVCWSFPQPVTADGVQELDEDDFDALVKAAKEIDDKRVTAEQLAEPSPDPQSPTPG